MISVAAGVRVLVASKPVDFRRGADSLAALAKEELQRRSFSGTILVFCSKRAVEDLGLGRVWPNFVLEEPRGRGVSLAADQRRRHAAVGLATRRAGRWPRLVVPARGDSPAPEAAS
jgi:hypothetical protein